MSDAASAADDDDSLMSLHKWHLAAKSQGADGGGGGCYSLYSST